MSYIDFKEELHPRGGKGSAKGGQFVAKGGGGAAAKSKAPLQWLKLPIRHPLDDVVKQELSKYKNTTTVDQSIATQIPLTDSESSAITNFVKGDYGVRLNAFLRAVPDPEQLEPAWKKMSDTLDTLSENAMLTEDVLLYRQLSLEGIRRLKKLKPGDVISDAAFTSTTFSKLDNSIKIMASKGSHGIAVPVDLGRDQEFILPRNTRMEYVGDDPSDNTKVFKLTSSPVTAKTEKKKGKLKAEDFAKDKVNLRLAGGAIRDKFFQDWEEKVDDTPGEFKKDFLGGVDSTMSIDSYHDGSWSLQGQLLDDKGETIGEYHRTIDLGRKVAESALLRISSAKRNNNIGKDILAGNIEMYKKLGIEKVKVHANIDVGGYAWAKYGYVPSRESWEDLRYNILRRLGGDSGRRSTSTSTYTPESWEELGSDQQGDIKQRWMNDARSEFIDNEISNWRENGEDLHVAKQELVREFEDRRDDWSEEVLADWRKDAEPGADFPFTDKQILDATTLTYDEDDYEGRKDPEVEFDDVKLSAFIQDPPAQLEFQYLGAANPADKLTPEMREEITKALVDAFNDKAERNRGDVEPPDYASDQANESMEQYWDQIDDRERFRIAERAGWLPEVEIENEDEDPPEDPVDAPKDENEELRRLANSSDPKAIWAISDSSRGKDLLLNSDWNGYLNLKDEESMGRFNAYVSKGRTKDKASLRKVA